MALLLILQGLWLNREYTSSKEAFERESNILFRSTIHQITDSLFFGNLQLSFDKDSTEQVKEFFAQLQEGNQKMMRSLRSIQIKKIDQGKNLVITGDSILTINTSKNAEDISGNNMIWRNGRAGSSMAMRYIFNLGFDSFDTVALANSFRAGMDEKWKKLSIRVLEKAAAEREFYQSSDTLDYTTSFMRLGSQHLYAIHFPGGKNFVYKALIPQIGFSVVLSSLIGISFLLLLKNMRDQERLIAQKNQFISNVSHELKTPVATVSVALEALKNFNVLQNPAKAQEYLHIAGKELDRLSLMVDKILKTNIFDLEKEISRGKKPIDPSDLWRKTTAAFSLLAEKKGMEISCDISDGIYISGHEEHLEMMLYNLVDNAIKYGKSLGKVAIKWQKEGSQAELTVRDDGCGIPEEYQDRIFDRFFRVPSGNVHDVKGYGLGLHYVAGVVKSHQGRIQVESIQGQGSIFTIKFPLNDKN